MSGSILFPVLRGCDALPERNERRVQIPGRRRQSQVQPLIAFFLGPRYQARQQELLGLLLPIRDIPDESGCQFVVIGSEP